MKEARSDIYQIPNPPFTPDREQALILAGGLAWAVGKLEGLGQETGMAGKVLEQWQNPIRFIPNEDVDP